MCREGVAFKLLLQPAKGKSNLMTLLLDWELLLASSYVCK